MATQELSKGVPDSGHAYSSIRASKTLTPTGDLQETFIGMDQVRLIKRIAEMTDIRPILRKLQCIKKYLLNCDNMRCSVNVTPQQLSQMEQAVGDFLRGLGRSKKERKQKPAPNESGGSTHISGSQVVRKLITPTFKPCQMKTHFLLPFPVNYVGKCVSTAPYTDPDHARDPCSTETLQSFAKAIDWAMFGRFSQQDTDKAKLSVFSSVDAAVAPSDKELDHFLYGLSDELTQAHREQLFAVHPEGLIDVSSECSHVAWNIRDVQ